MSEFFTLVVISSIWVLGLKIVTEDGMLLQDLRKKAEEIHKEGSKWIEPALLCPWCMPSLHSLIGYGFGWATGLVVFERVWWNYVAMYPLVVMLSSLVCGLTWQLYKGREVKNKLNTHLENLAHLDIKDRKQQFQQRYSKDFKSERR